MRWEIRERISKAKTPWKECVWCERAVEEVKYGQRKETNSPNRQGTGATMKLCLITRKKETRQPFVSRQDKPAGSEGLKRNSVRMNHEAR